MEKGNKKYIVIICILIGIITFLMGLIVGMFINLKAFQPVSGNTVSTETSSSTVIEKTGNEEEKTYSSTVSTSTEDTPVVSTESTSSQSRDLYYSGYKFVIPNDYSVMFPDYGPVVYMNDIFQMRLVVKEENTEQFNTYYDNPSELTEKAVNVGWTITKECKAYNLDGKDYFIFCGSCDGEDYVVFRTQIDDEHIFAGNMAILSSSIDEEDYLNVISGLAKDIEKTDKPDSTLDSFYSSGSSVYLGEEKAESTITTKEFSVTYKIPEGLYMSDETTVYGSDDGEVYSYNDAYLDADWDMVDVWIRNENSGAQQYISNHYMSEGNEIKTFELNGRTFYFIERNRQDNDGNIQQFLIVTDINDTGWVYEVKTYSTSKKYELDTLKKYCEITIK